MELIDRYVHAVGKWIWTKQREEIQTELQSVLVEKLEARMSAREMEESWTSLSVGEREEARQEEMAKILREYGSPAKVASAYTNTNQLIGPGVFPVYTAVLRIVLFAVAIGLTVAFAVSALFNPESGSWTLQGLRLLGTYIAAALQAFGMVTLIFALLERTLDRSEWEKEAAEEEIWDPSSLPPGPVLGNEIKRGTLVANICLIVLALLVFNSAPALEGVSRENGVRFLLMLSTDAVRAYLPLWNVFFLLGLVLQLWLLASGIWKDRQRVVQILLHLFGIYILYSMIAGPSLLEMGDSLLTGNRTSGDLGPVLEMLDKVLTWAYAVGIIGTLADIWQQGRAIRKNRRGR
ncbi:hypothetical protein [Anaerotalea alkaliphila]|uniref:Uncharacterized protein n=1 Tax=Anaerotalea alkaliphila TaxID=2662126 RepID=A0A7X5KP78_9FIRM|nr:hypothetical protein [Anaerotalea alkaliphila]NDL68688.1 hypothetical protein [Anaerotalea alkaliphila]